MLINGVAKLLDQFLAPVLGHSRFQFVDQIHIIRLGLQSDFYEFAHAGNIFPEFTHRLIVISASRVAAGSCPFSHGGYTKSRPYLFSETNLSRPRVLVSKVSLWEARADSIAWREAFILKYSSTSCRSTT